MDVFEMKRLRIYRLSGTPESVVALERARYRAGASIQETANDAAGFLLVKVQSEQFPVVPEGAPIPVVELG